MADKVDFGPRVGADPELFVIARKGGEYTKNTVIPVCGIVGGTKDAPIKVDRPKVLGEVVKRRPTFIAAADPDEAPRPEPKEEAGDFAYQEDNVMFEFNIPAATHQDAFTNNVYRFLDYLQATILEPKNMMFAWMNTYKFPIKALVHPLAHVIGCSPDFNAYLPRNQQMRTPFHAAQLGQQRFCGGHLHVQYNYNNIPREIFIRFMDLVVGLPFLRLDKQEERRNFYGKAGTYRPKEYGVEYRTPSNFWLDPKHRESSMITYLCTNIFNLACYANAEPAALSNIYKRVPWPDVEKAINTEDTKLAGEIARYASNTLLPFRLYTHNGTRISGY